VGEVLKENCTNLQLLYLPTIMTGSIPKYSYRLQDGITADRHVMIIIGNEGIIELLRECI
jgi:DNA mismatch repair protein MutS